MRNRKRLRQLTRAGLTVALLAVFAVRLFRFLESRESVLAFFYGSGGAVWDFLGTLLLFGPFAVTLTAALAVWLRGETARRLGLFSCIASGFFMLDEAFTLFARSMNGHSAYVGASPLLSAAVGLLAGLTLRLRFRRVSSK